MAVAYKINAIQIVDSCKIQINSPTTNNVAQVIIKYLGHPGNAVQDLDDGTVWMSFGEAARKIGVSPTTVANHIKGKIPTAGGHHLVQLTEAGIPIT